MTIPDYASIPLDSTWPTDVTLACYKYNECIAVYGQWEVNRPDIFLSTVLPLYANDGHVNDRTPEQRQQRYESTLTPDGLVHEYCLLDPTHTPWGIVRNKDGLSKELLTRIREREERMHEWVMDIDVFSSTLVADLVKTTNRIIVGEQQQAYRDIKASSEIRNQKVIELNGKYHLEALIKTAARMEAILTEAYKQGGTLEQVWARVINGQ